MKTYNDVLKILKEIKEEKDVEIVLLRFGDVYLSLSEIIKSSSNVIVFREFLRCNHLGWTPYSAMVKHCPAHIETVIKVSKGSDFRPFHLNMCPDEIMFSNYMDECIKEIGSILEKYYGY